jgi:hypothetical protein
VFSLAKIAYVEICMKCNIYQYHAWFISCMFKSFCWMTIFDFILVLLFFSDLLSSSENFLDLDSMVLNCNFDCAPNIYIIWIKAVIEVKIANAFERNLKPCSIFNLTWCCFLHLFACQTKIELSKFVFGSARTLNAYLILFSSSA